jgi:hypothetical protein
VLFNFQFYEYLYLFNMTNRKLTETRCACIELINESQSVNCEEIKLNAELIQIIEESGIKVCDCLRIIKGER